MNILAGRGSKPSIFGLTAESSESKYVGKFYREARELVQSFLPCGYATLLLRTTCMRS